MKRNITNSTPRPLPALCLLLATLLAPGLLLPGCGAASRMRAQQMQAHDSIEQMHSRAYRCEPKALALAESHVEMASWEISQGDFSRAKDHLNYATPLVEQADVGSRAPICLGDRDGDGYPDASDSCPDDPENFNNIEDEDGCPEADRDGDGYLDPLDKCPDNPEDFDGFQDEEGCPDPDNDVDKVCDPWVASQAMGDKYINECKGIDKCPDDPEDHDGFQDDDGCPDADNDNDGFCDPWVASQGLQQKYATLCKSIDKCPDIAEVINGFEDDDGCADEGAVAFTPEKIELSEQIFFDTGKATIKPVSFPVLDQVVSLLASNPRIKRIRVEGHTDDVGNAKKNLKLSKDRAASVMAYFVKQGIDPMRLSSEGYGEDMPLIEIKGLKKKALKEAQAQNRRVEIRILELAPQ
jgi:outer membrane protein OmpA-like peptidoglycan-associated protein